MLACTQIYGYFDGASQVQGTRCGAGGVIFISPSLNNCWKLNLGVGTNTIAELVGLWALLYLARYFGLTHLQVCGDSEVIINWFEGTQCLNVLYLVFWKERILKLREDFELIKVHHIFREFNSEVDGLSNLALLSEVTCLIWWKMSEGIMGPVQVFNLSCLNTLTD